MTNPLSVPDGLDLKCLHCGDKIAYAQFELFEGWFLVCDGCGDKFQMSCVKKMLPAWLHAVVWLKNEPLMADESESLIAAESMRLQQTDEPIMVS